MKQNRMCMTLPMATNYRSALAKPRRGILPYIRESQKTKGYAVCVKPWRWKTNSIFYFIVPYMTSCERHTIRKVLP